ALFDVTEQSVKRAVEIGLDYVMLTISYNLKHLADKEYHESIDEMNHASFIGSVMYAMSRLLA
ncbi:hypothetical protein H2O73_21065, partial [Vibrio sp. 404]|nr:hypothetical protein [Vibrio marinisediminis]